jgi:hypothetical protein
LFLCVLGLGTVHVSTSVLLAHNKRKANFTGIDTESRKEGTEKNQAIEGNNDDGRSTGNRFRKSWLRWQKKFLRCRLFSLLSFWKAAWFLQQEINASQIQRDVLLFICDLVLFISNVFDTWPTCSYFGGSKNKLKQMLKNELRWKSIYYDENRRNDEDLIASENPNHSSTQSTMPTNVRTSTTTRSRTLLTPRRFRKRQRKRWSLA